MHKTAAEVKAHLAYLALQLSTLRLSAKHNIICIRMAISKNIDAENYGAASELLRVCLAPHLRDLNLIYVIEQ